MSDDSSHHSNESFTSPVRMNMTAELAAANASTVCASTLRKTLSRFNPRKTETASDIRRLNLDPDPVPKIIDTEFFNFLASHLDTDLLETMAVSLFEAPDATLLTDVNERMIEMIGNEDQTVWELALKIFIPKLIPEIIQLQRSALRTLALSSAPVLCSTFNLISSDAKLEDITAPSHTLIETLAKLEPIYAKLRALQVTMSSNEMKRARTQKLLDGANATLQNLDSDLSTLGAFNIFSMLSSWSDDDSAKLMLNCRKYVKDNPSVKSHPDRMDWEIIATDIDDHDADECKQEYERVSAEDMLKSGATLLSKIDTQMKSLLAQKQLLMIELSKADVPSSHLNAHEKLNSTQRDTGKLVINITAVMGNCNPKVLIDIMKAFTSYFDQNPGSYSITRALLIYIHAEFLSNNVTIAFPMQSNDYSLGDNAGFKALMAPYLEQESHALARILTAVSTDLVEDVCESRQIKTSIHQNTNPTELFKANKRCGLSMIFAMFHKHSEKNHEFMRAMKAALSSLIGVLANKQDTLHELMRGSQRLKNGEIALLTRHTQL